MCGKAGGVCYLSTSISSISSTADDDDDGDDMAACRRATDQPFELNVESRASSIEAARGRLIEGMLSWRPSASVVPGADGKLQTLDRRLGEGYWRAEAESRGQLMAHLHVFRYDRIVGKSEGERTDMATGVI
jgi:hypothetical protein